MALVFQWDVSTNLVTITGGTYTASSETDRALFHTADLAGTQPGGSGLDDGRVLLDGGVIDADPDTFSLTTQPHPCEQLAVPLIISASADRAGATLDLVGTDKDDEAISETGIDISGANSAPVTTTLKFKTVDAAGITANGMTNDDTLTIKQERWGVIWYYGPYNWKFDSRLLNADSLPANCTFTLITVDTPTNVAAATAARGPLVAGTTYYYRVIAVRVYELYSVAVSLPCAEVSATPDAVNKTIKGVMLLRGATIIVEQLLAAPYTPANAGDELTISPLMKLGNVPGYVADPA